jgi:hypothetical protein
MARMILLALVAGLVAAPASAIAAETKGSTDDVVLRREDDAAEIAVADDDDGGSGDGTGTGGNGSASGNSNDGTGSGHSAVSRDGEASQGDRTRDRTRDGAGDRLRRDWSGGHTNDSSRNDTR